MSRTMVVLTWFDADLETRYTGELVSSESQPNPDLIEGTFKRSYISDTDYAQVFHVKLSEGETCGKKE